MGKHHFAFAFCALAFTERAASADPAREAAFFDALGRRAYRAGHYEEALESFQLVQEIAPSYRQLYNIALSADLAGRSDMAFSLYQEYLRSEDPDGTRRTAAETRAARLGAKLALVELTSDPPGTLVYVDRKEMGLFGVTPATIAIPEGEHRLLIEGPGYAPESASVIAKAGSLARVSVSLKALVGRIAVEITPPSAALRFFRDGAPVSAEGVSPGTSSYRLPTGSYRIVASAPGYVATERQVVVRESEEARLDLDLVPLRGEVGRLLVSTGSVAAAVFLDGRRVAVAPAVLDGIAVGQHLLEVRAGLRGARRRLSIQKGRATYVEIDLGSHAP